MISLLKRNILSDAFFTWRQMIYKAAKSTSTQSWQVFLQMELTRQTSWNTAEMNRTHGQFKWLPIRTYSALFPQIQMKWERFSGFYIYVYSQLFWINSDIFIHYYILSHYLLKSFELTSTLIMTKVLFIFE